MFLLDRKKQIHFKSKALKSGGIIETLKAGGASVRLVNAISFAIESNQFHYQNLSEIPATKVNDAFFHQLMKLPNLGRKSAIEFVKIAQNYKLAQPALLTTEETKPNTNKLPKIEILKALELRGASDRLKNVLMNVIESGELKAKFLNELPICIDGSVSYLHILKLRYMGKKNADEFLSIVKSFMADNQTPNTSEIKVDSLSDRIQFSLGFDFKKPEKIIASSPSAFFDLLLKKALSPKEYKVLIKRYGATDKPKTLEEVGLDLNVTRERVRQIQVKSLKKIKMKLQAIGLNTIKDLLHENTKAQLFHENELLASGQLKNKLDKSEFWLKIYVFSLSKTSKGFMNQHFSFVKSLDAWTWMQESSQTKLYENIQKGLSLNTAIMKAHWPITVAGLSHLMAVPGHLVKFQLGKHPKKFSIKNVNGNEQVLIKRLTNANAIRFVLRKRGAAMSSREIQAELKTLFDKSLSVNLVQSTVNRLPDMLIVGRGKYLLYESFHLNDAEQLSIRNAVESYLLERQNYISVKVIHIQLSKTKFENHKIFQRINDYMLLGILQDDARFCIGRGMMVGLSTASFKGTHVGLREEVVRLLSYSKRPWSVKELIDELSDRRQLIEPSLYSNLREEPQLIEIRPSIFQYSGNSNPSQDSFDDWMFDD